MEGCSQGVLLRKSKVILGYIYRRMTCGAQEAIIRLPCTLVRYLLNMMPSLSHFEMWELRVGNDATGNPYLDWILKNLDHWKQPFHNPPIIRLQVGERRMEREGSHLRQRFLSNLLASHHRIFKTNSVSSPRSQGWDHLPELSLCRDLKV